MDSYEQIRRFNEWFREGRSVKRPNNLWALYANLPKSNKILDRELQEIIRKKKEGKYATKKRVKQEDSISKHKGTEEVRETTETGSSDSVE